MMHEEKHSGFPTREMINEGAYQGDMMLDDDQWEIVRAAEEDDNGATLGKRKAMKALSKRWPKAQIPYYVESDISTYLIMSATKRESGH